MATIKVERRALPGWMMAVVAALVIAVYLIFAFWARPAPFAELGLANVQIMYEGRAWIPADVSQAAQFPDAEMVAVGERDGRTLWANSARGLGGGGGGLQVPARLETGPYHRIYLRLDHGRYLPLVWRDAVPSR